MKELKFEKLKAIVGGSQYISDSFIRYLERTGRIIYVPQPIPPTIKYK